MVDLCSLGGPVYRSPEGRSWGCIFLEQIRYLYLCGFIVK